MAHLCRVVGVEWSSLSGEGRYVPILTAIVLIWILFGVWDPKFLSPRNLSNLSLQNTVTGILTLGLVPVLIIRPARWASSNAVAWCG